MNLTNQQKFNIASVLGLIIALLSTVLQFINNQPAESATPLSANVPCYFDQGGKQFNVGNGCTLLVASGGIVSAVSGSRGVAVGFGGTISNGVTLSHGLGGTPLYATCTVSNSGVLTTSVYISATSATTVALGVFDSAGTAVTANTVVNCLAVR